MYAFPVPRLIDLKNGDINLTLNYVCEVFNMVGYIYKYENKINGKKYVGQTKKTPKERAGKNFQRYYGKFGNAIKKYGADMFKLEILAKVDLPLPELTEKLNELETYYIHKYDCVNNGYNLCPFGNASKGWSDEMRRKLSNTNKGHLTSAETRAKISKANKGHKTAELTPELSKKLSEAGKKGALAKKVNIIIIMEIKKLFMLMANNRKVGLKEENQYQIRLVKNYQ